LFINVSHHCSGTVKDATIASIGFFMNMRQAANPEQKWDMVKPVLPLIAARVSSHT
jgi:hypothetical protein